MKKFKILFILLCFVLYASLTSAANAETTLSAKQLMLAKLQDTSFGVTSELYKTSSGMVSYEIKTLDAAVIPKTEPFNNLAGTKLLVDYKLNSPDKKLEANYTVHYNENNYSGSVYMNDNRIIFSTGIMSLLKALNPAEFSKEMTIPQYIYTDNSEFTKIWDTIIKSNGQSMPPEVKDLFVFALEAVPDKYFTTSLADQKIIINIDKDGFIDVVFSVLQKVKKERERFADLVAKIAARSSGQDPTVLKKQILTGLEESISDGSFPDSRETIAKGMADLTLLNLIIETSLTTSEQDNFALTLKIADNSGLDGKITLNVNSNGSKDNKSGNFILNLTGANKEQGFKLEGQITSDFKQTTTNESCTGLLTLNVKDTSGLGTMLDLVLQLDSSAKVDRDVQINIPVLTQQNSANIENYMKEPAPPASGVRVLLDGKPVEFDVPPDTGNGRTMVPVRSLAEELGFEVKWVDPDQLIMSRADTTITMTLKQPFYTVNGVQKQLDVPPYTRYDRAMVPVRFIAEELGCQVQYDEKTNTVFITTKQ